MERVYWRGAGGRVYDQVDCFSRAVAVCAGGADAMPDDAGTADGVDCHGMRVRTIDGDGWCGDFAVGAVSEQMTCGERYC